jgi:TldD protein
MGYDLAEYAVEYASQRGASYAEARFERIESSSFIMKNGVLEVSDYSRLEGMGIRVLINGSMAFAAVDKPGRAGVKQAAEAALKIACLTARLRRKPLTLAPAELRSRRWWVKEKHPLRSVSTEEGVALLEDVEKALLAAEAKVPARFLHLSLNYREKRIVNSEGVRLSSALPLVTFYYLITVAEAAKGSAQRSLTYSKSVGWEAIEEWDLPKAVSREAAALAENLRKGRKAPKGRVDVVAGSEIVGIAVHESAGHPYEADRILGREGAQAGESFVRREMLGTRIGSRAVTVVDDPRIEGSAGYYLCDDEGVKARRRVLIKEGVINEFLLNRESAAMLGLESNGAARASSYDREPLVRMSTTYMLPGEYSEEELFEEVKRGVYIRSFMEWNIDDLRYHQRYVGCEAYLIERGELSRPVRQPVLELTTPAFYSSIDALSKSVEFYAGNCGKGEPMQSLPVWLGGPIARLRNVRLRQR